MIETSTLWAILLMASATYLTRVLGYIGLRNRRLSPWFVVMMDAAPGCVLISVIAPSFVSSEPSGLMALAVTIIAAIHLPMLPTVAIGVTAAWLFRVLVV